MTTDLHEQTRDLPNGHDNPDSPMWVEPEHRSRYQRVPVPAATFEAALDGRREREDRADLLATWERWRALKEARYDPTMYAKWLRNNTRNGVPTEGALATIPDRPVNFPGSPKHRRALTPGQVRETEHQVVLRLVSEELAREHIAAQSAKRRLVEFTCEVCGVFSSATKTAKLGGTTPHQACPACTALVPLLRMAAEASPGGGTRAEAIAAWLTASTGAQILSDADADAAIDGDGPAPWEVSRNAAPHNQGGGGRVMAALFGRRR